MPKYFFNIVLNGLPVADHTGREFPDDEAAREYAQHTAMLLVPSHLDHTKGFIAVSRDGGFLLFRVPIPEPTSAYEG